ncbi:molybdopterin-dependent oxidoreductase [Microcoleus sp. FACHB-831]|uniref:molybdopterin-dependent oxidoreductase n=1 Tax=Microcoleus sp. FACHB-831 TaxID=2692827 RepID=UPI0018F0088D|nr:molybdopterin-dependent oxidoreductase [Microcoleus sp. FACHB-831]
MKAINTKPQSFSFFRLLKLWPVAFLSACTNEPTDAQLNAWRQQAIAQNAVMVAVHKKDDRWQNWELAITGQIPAKEPVRLDFEKLNALATTIVKTQEPHHTSNPKAIFSFRAIPVAKLLDQLGVKSDVKEVTFVSYDAYRATVTLEDLKRYPIAIALERNGKPLSRSEGGPLYLIFPYTDYPELQIKYPDRFWAFYVTNIVVGTEQIKLRVGDSASVGQKSSGKSDQPSRTLDINTLDKLQQVTIEEPVGYPIGWPIGKVKLQGVRLRDAIAASGVALPEGSVVVVRGKPPVYRDPLNPSRLAAKDLRDCDILLATRWGNDRQPIPAHMGGPLTLALPASCQARDDKQRWMTFVEEIEVIDSP